MKFIKHSTAKKALKAISILLKTDSSKSPTADKRITYEKMQYVLNRK